MRPNVGLYIYIYIYEVEIDGLVGQYPAAYFQRPITKFHLISCLSLITRFFFYFVLRVFIDCDGNFYFFKKKAQSSFA